MMSLKFIVALFLVEAYAGNPCTTPNNEPGECLELSSCAVLYKALQVKHDAYIDEFVEKSICGGTKFIPMVCCGLSPNFNVTKITSPAKSGKNLLPSTEYCGYQHSDDYYRAENDTSVRINEFPWLARLIHASDSNGTDAFLDCGGSLINTRYILTSGYCVDKDLYEIIGVRLGEFHYINETDCIEEPPYEIECSASEDFGIEKIIRHPNYSNVDDSNDIALLRLNRTVKYSDYIRPICLSFAETVRVGDLLITSGWGHGRYARKHKKRMIGKLVTKEECIRNMNLRIFPSLGKNFNENNICTILQDTKQQEGCNSDLGGPVMFSHNFQWYQEAVVSFSITCGERKEPEILLKLTNYLKWIEDSLEP